MGKRRVMLALVVGLGLSACGQGSAQQASDERTTAGTSVEASDTPRSPEPTRMAATSSAPVAVSTSPDPVDVPSPPAITVPAPVPPSSGPAGVPSPPAISAPASVPPVAPGTEEPVPDLTTYAGTAADASFEFDHPSAWTVTDTSSGPSGFFEVKGPDGEPIATLQLLIAWGAVCDAGCKYHPVSHLEEVAGSTLSTGLPFSVRSTAMDLSHDPEERRIHQWTDNVRVQTSLSSGAMLPADPEMLPRLLYSLGNVDTGVTASNGVTTRTVIFTASRDVASMQAAIDYTESEEYLQIQAMMASFRG